MVHHAISLFSQNQAKLYYQTKSEEVWPLSKQIKLLGDLLDEFLGNRKVGATKSAICCLEYIQFPLTGRAYKRAKVQCNGHVFWARHG